MNGYDSNLFYAAHELSEAVAQGFLTKDEARLVYWSQFHALKMQATTVPPAIQS